MNRSRFHLLPPGNDLDWTPFAWLIYFPALFVSPVIAGASTTVWVATIAVAAAFLPLYFRGFWCRSTRESYRIIAAIAVLGMLLAPVNPGAAVLTIYAASFAGNLQPIRHARIAIAAVVAAVLLEALALQLSPAIWVWQSVISIIVGFSNTHFAKVRATNFKLRRANEEIGHLAKLAERERIGRDLHDLLGHTLSLITLKASLASRLAERDPARAVIEIRDVERISREALSEVRAAVAGYRDTGLPSEISNAKSMLEAAGVEMHVNVEPVQLLPPEEAVLSMILREAVTNVVRHSKARSCSIALTDASGVRAFSIQDDGIGKQSPDGHGITGMRERVTALSGYISVESIDGTRIRVTLPSLAPEQSALPAPVKLSIVAS